MSTATLTRVPPLTSACNLRCAMCLVRYRPPVNKLAGALPLDLYRRLLDEVPPLRRLTLQGLGEPLLSPYLLDMIRLAKRNGVEVGFNSNATLLTRAKADALVATGLDWLHVSLDGARAGTFEAIRDGADFAKVVANLAGLVAAKRAAGGDKPWIRVVFVAMRRNVAELPELVELMGRVGVQEVRVQNLAHDFADTPDDGPYREIRDYTAAEALWTGADRAASAAAFGRARTLADAAGLELRLPHLSGTPGSRCTWPWDAAYVTSAGIVQPCCMVMGDDRVALGNLHEATFPTIWAGPAYQEFRARLADDDNPPEVCRGCSLYQHTF